MKNLLKNITLAFNILVYPIRKYITQIKLKLMDKTLSELLNILSQMTHNEISDVVIHEEYLSFKYRGGTFEIYKNFQSNINDIGYLKVYHRTPLSKDLIEVTGFYVSADKYNQIRITNSLDTTLMNPLLQAIVQKGTIGVTTDILADMFPKQFHAKMQKDNFSITPFTF